MDFQHAYFAGFFDGEGCVRITRYKSKGILYHRLTLSLYNCNKEVLEAARSLYGGWIHERGRLARVGKSWRVHFELTLLSGKAANALRIWVPLLIVKREEAELAIKFQNARKPHTAGSRWTHRTEEDVIRDEISLEEMKRLKHQALVLQEPLQPGKSWNKPGPPPLARNEKLSSVRQLESGISY